MIRTLLMLLAGWSGLVGTGAALAHELRPAYLELRESARDTFEIAWKVPSRDEGRLALYVRLPANCTAGQPMPLRVGDAVVERWQAACAGGLTGRDVAVAGLSATLTDVLVRLERRDGTTQVARLTPEKPAFTVHKGHDRLAVIATYFIQGVEHILVGVDHLLFVLALLLIVSGWRKLLATITAFTIAHSITLGAATLGLVWVPGPPVEAVIALSIVFLAGELIRMRQGRDGLTARFPWLVAFTFGLLHGLGFAGALAEVGLPARDIPLALLMFNVGVEAGQVLFVAAVLALVRCVDRLHIAWPAWSRQAPAYGIGTVAAFWFVERVAAF